MNTDFSQLTGAFSYKYQLITGRELGTEFRPLIRLMLSMQGKDEKEIELEMGAAMFEMSLNSCTPFIIHAAMIALNPDLDGKDMEEVVMIAHEEGVNVPELLQSTFTLLLNDVYKPQSKKKESLPKVKSQPKRKGPILSKDS